MSLFVATNTACAPAPAAAPTMLATEPVPTAETSIPTQTTMPEPVLPAGWQTYPNQELCGYSISHPAELQGASQDVHSWLLSPVQSDPAGTVRNFIFVSVIPDDFQGGEIIYNYDPAEAETLRNLQVGQSAPVRDLPDMAQWFTYTRLPDVTLNNQTVQAYENTAPWEFPAGTREVRYYLQSNGCTYLIGGYLDATGSNPAGSINQELFNQIVATFHTAP
jgi:hypothetical protein